MLPGRYMHYQVLESLGQGTYGEVCLAVHTILEEKVALRFLPRELTGATDVSEGLLTEARRSIGIRHRYLAQVKAIEEEAGLFVVCSEYIDGPSLTEAHARRRPTLGEAVKLAAAVALGVAEAHRHGILHRNLKPRNVRLPARGGPKLLDLGIKLPLDPTRVPDPQELGYLAPEHLRGGDPIAASDIWSFGALLFWLLTGQHPFGGKDVRDVTRAVLTQPTPRPRQVRKGIPGEVDRLVHDCLQRDPTLRPQAMAEVARRLGSLIEQPRSGARPARR